MLGAVHRQQVFPMLRILLAGPLLNLVLPVLIRDGIVEKSDTIKVSVETTNPKYQSRNLRIARRRKPNLSLHIVDSLTGEVKLALRRQ